jgi:hypothetical protein
VRHRQSFVVNLLIIIQKDVEVNIPRPLIYQLFSAQLPFDILEFIQKRKRLKFGLNLDTASDFKLTGAGR